MDNHESLQDGPFDVDHDPPATFHPFLISEIITHAKQDFQSNDYIMNNALPIVHLVKLKTNELSDQTPRKSLKVEANGEPVFDDHIYDAEVQNCLFLKVTFEQPLQQPQHCFITSNMNYILFNCSDQVRAQVLPHSSSHDIDFTNMTYRYHHSTDEIEVEDLPSNCLLHPVCYPDHTIGYSEDRHHAIVGCIEQRLDMQLVGFFSLHN